MWLEHPEFRELIMSLWNVPDRGSNGMFRLASKLKRVKGKLAEWNKLVFRKTKEVIRETLVKIKDFDDKEEWNVVFFKCDLDWPWKREAPKGRSKVPSFGGQEHPLFSSGGESKSSHESYLQNHDWGH
ncbi:hypothetical protein LINPERHAP2_LOCUS364 [Linum perenne]